MPRKPRKGQEVRARGAECPKGGETQPPAPLSSEAPPSGSPPIDAPASILEATPSGSPPIDAPASIRPTRWPVLLCLRQLRLRSQLLRFQRLRWICRHWPRSWAPLSRPPCNSRRRRQRRRAGPPWPRQPIGSTATMRRLLHGVFIDRGRSTLRPKLPSRSLAGHLLPELE